MVCEEYFLREREKERHKNRCDKTRRKERRRREERGAPYVPFLHFRDKLSYFILDIALEKERERERGGKDGL